MSWGDQVDVMTAYLLQVEHHFCQPLIVILSAVPFVGDGPVLAEHATEVTVGEEDGTRSMLSNEGYLFAKMRLSHINQNSGWSPAESELTGFPVRPALPWTQLALLEHRVGLLNPLYQSALFLQLSVGGMPLLSFLDPSAERTTWEKQ